MKKTIKNGYYTIKKGSGKDRILHFSMNCWSELKSDTGMSVVDWSKGFTKGDTIDQALHISDLLYASAKAYDLEEGNKINYNIHEARTWVQSFTEKDSLEFVAALGWSVSPNIAEEEGK